MARRQPRGFAAMDQKRQRKIASDGGRAAHESGNAHEFTTEEARRAGRRGGLAVSRDRAHMAEIGRRGGKESHRRGTAHEWDRKEAREAGRRGGHAAHRSPDRDYPTEADRNREGTAVKQLPVATAKPKKREPRGHGPAEATKRDTRQRTRPSAGRQSQ